MRLVLIRHPAPVIATGLCYGSSDLDADPAALAAALAALPAQLPPQADALAIHSSPLRRCTALAGPLAAIRHARPPVLDARLAEMDFGQWEGRAWDAIPRAEIDAWAQDPVHYAPGGGETVLQVAARVAGFLADCEDDAIVVCHAGTIRLLTALCEHGASLEDAALAAASTPHHIDYAAVRILQFR